jgi:excisionase family DNA binding protein
MPLVTIRTAAELTGKDRTTLNRAIASGKLSATKSDFGHYLIDPAELERVYGTLHTPAQVRLDELHNSGAQAHTDAVALALTREMLERERAERERERQQWEEERAFFRELVGKQTDQLKLLTDQREQAPRPGFWARMLRRA